MKEQITPAQKPVNAREGIQDGGHKHLTTPKEANGKYWNYDKEQTNKIMK